MHCEWYQNKKKRRQRERERGEERGGIERGEIERDRGREGGGGERGREGEREREPKQFETTTCVSWQTTAGFEKLRRVSHFKEKEHCYEIPRIVFVLKIMGKC